MNDITFYYNPISILKIFDLKEIQQDSLSLRRKAGAKHYLECLMMICRRSKEGGISLF